MNIGCKSENWNAGVIAFVKHFCTNSQKLKSFLDKGADKCNKNATFVAEVLYYTQKIRTKSRQFQWPNIKINSRVTD